MDLINQYGLFLLEIFTLVGVIAWAVVMVKDAGGGGDGAGLYIRRLDKHFERLAEAVAEGSMSPKQRKQAQKSRKKEKKVEDKVRAKTARRRIFVLDFEGDLRASGTRSLRQEVSAIVASAQSGDEVLVRLDSPGGTVTGYGLAASQLARLKKAGVRLTVAVDKVAASGGYMMACVADRILAAPFAVVGSIGVVYTVPNVNRLLKEHNVDIEMLTAGKYKRTLTLLGENTDEGRAKVQTQIEEMHTLFKSFINEHRPALDIEAVATGEYWQGIQAKDLGLVDEISTSDDWLLSAWKEADILCLEWKPRSTVGGRLKRIMGSLMGGAVDASQQAELDARLP